MTDPNTYVTRKEREEEFRRNLVLDAAEALIAEKGYHGTTVSDIAERSELAKGSLYQLFASKEEIIGALIKRKMDYSLVELYVILDSAATAKEKIKALLNHKIRSLWENRHYARIFLKELRSFHLPVDIPGVDEHMDVMKKVMERIQNVFAEGQKSDEFRCDIPAASLFAAFDGITNGVLRLILDKTESEVDIESEINHTMELLFHGISPVSEGK